MSVTAHLSPEGLHRPLVVADIGGTNARFGWVDEAGQGVTQVHSLPTAEFSGPAEAMQHYLSALPPGHRARACDQGLQAAWALATADFRAMSR